MNSVNLIGRMVRDPELKEYGKGKDAGSVVRFTLAVQRDKDNADFISCVAFGGTAELIDTYFSKGSLFGVSGRIQTGSYEDKEGNKRYTTDVIVNRVTFCSSSGDSQDGDFEDTEDEDLPFNDEKKKAPAKKKTRR